MKTSSLLVLIMLLARTSLAGDIGAKARITTSVPEGRVVRIVVEPGSVFLSGASTRQSLIVSGERSDGSVVDLTSGARFSSDDPRIAVVEQAAGVRAVGKGATYVRARAAGLDGRAFIVVRDSAEKPRPFSFANDVAPIFSHIGCNASSCHGALRGQNGFKLSLFGYDPDADYEA